jgi:type IV pilus assembly protein PilA
MKQITRTNQKGFTLIELMIVIAIIGILAAIAIPNYISYRDKAFCSSAENDAFSIAGGLSDYFAIPSNQTYTDVPAGTHVIPFPGSNAITLSGQNDASVTFTAATATVGSAYRIQVTDQSSRCPLNYQANLPRWSNATPGVFSMTL